MLIETRMAVTPKRFELCLDLKSLPAVSARELPIGLRWRASRPKAEFPAPEKLTQSGRVLGEQGVKRVDHTE